MALTEKYISADSHVVEPADLWTKRMGGAWRERAPHFIEGADTDYMIVEGIPPVQGADLMAGMMDDKLKGRALDRSKNHFRDVRPESIDPKLRLGDQDIDHIRAEVLYPNYALMLYGAPDPEYKRECCRAYNDWLIEFCSAAPKRYVGVAMLPTSGTIEWAVKEAERVRRAGLQSVTIPSCQPKTPWWDPYYKPLWAALQDHEMILAFHNAATEEPVRQDLPLLPLVLDLKMVGQVRTLGGILSSGVPQDYPKLKFVVVEGGIGWVAAAVRLLDHLWEDHRGWIEPHLDEAPSFYCKRQFYFTFEDDKAGLLTRELLNVDHLMWGSDYPHTEGTFPRSREQIAKDFAQLSEAETRKMVIDNAAKLYGI